MPPNRKLSQLRLGQWNANGICLKWDELKDFILEHKIDVMAVCETKLNDSINLSMPGYTITRKDRNRQGGGVMIICKGDIKHHELTTQTTSFETIGIKLDNGQCIFSSYAPPQTTININDLNNIFKTSKDVIMMGDLNAKHRTWGNLSYNKNGVTISNFVASKPITILEPGKPTTRPHNNNKPSTIDIALAKNLKELPEVTALDELNSDHLPITIDFDTQNPLTKDSCQRLNLRKINWDKFREKLQNNLEINNKLDTIEEIDKAVETITKVISDAMNQSAPPVKTLTPSSHLPVNIKKTIRLRNAARRRFQRTRADVARKLYNQLAHQTKKEIKEWKNLGWDTKLQKLKTSDNSLWGMTKALTKRKKYKMPPLKNGNETATTDEEKAEALANNFEKVHKLTEKMGDQTVTKDTEKLAGHIKNKTDTADDIQPTTPAEIKRIIKKFKNNKAPGADGIPNKVLKNLNKKALVQLNHIINACLKTGYFPTKWKEATVLALPKPGKDHKNVTNYRPISLLSTMSKILEKMILNRIRTQLGIEDLLIEEQYGFRSKRDTVKQLARVTYEIKNNFNMNRSTAAILLDIEKAFDTVWHANLIVKIDDLGTPTERENIQREDRRKSVQHQTHLSRCTARLDPGPCPLHHLHQRYPQKRKNQAGTLCRRYSRVLPLLENKKCH